MLGLCCGINFLKELERSNMKNLFFIFIVSVLLFTANKLTLAQEPAKPEAMTEAAPVAMTEAVPEAMAEPEKKVDPACACLKPAADAVEKAYSSVEEDEWEKAIKACKDSVTAIKNLAKTCKCPELPEYQKTAEAFQKYAEGGSHLDGAEEPNCPFALKLYSETIKSLGEATTKISDEKVKEYVSNVKDYAEEEEEFVKSECAGPKSK